MKTDWKGIMKTCRRCGKEIRKRYLRRPYLKGYRSSTEFCEDCNAVLSVVQRFEQSGNITVKELKCLPSKLIFDINDDNPHEKARGLWLQDIIKNISAGSDVGR